MEIVFSSGALKDFEYWKKISNQKILKRIKALLDAIEETPFKGIGKPEPLKAELSGYWSRRINDEHRLVYKVQDNKIFILSLRYHY